MVFRHPLARATAYSRAGARERRAAHAAVAESWPRQTIVAPGTCRGGRKPDAAIADLLADTAERAKARTAYSVASGAYERSARLSPDPERRANRVLQAAEAAWSAGLTERALGLLDGARREEPTSVRRVHALALRGAIAARTGRLRDAREMLLAPPTCTDPAEESC